MNMLASLVAQMARNLSAMQETQIGSLGLEDPWRREWLSTPVFLPVEFHGQRSLVSCSPLGCKDSDMTKHTCTHTQIKFDMETIISENPGHVGS